MSLQTRNVKNCNYRDYLLTHEIYPKGFATLPCRLSISPARWKTRIIIFGMFFQQIQKLPKNSGIHPDSSGIIPKSSGINPESSGINPKSSGIDLKSSGNEPKSSGIDPESSGIEPKSSGIEPK